MTTLAEMRHTPSVVTRTVEQHRFDCTLCNTVGDWSRTMPQASHAGWLHEAHAHGTPLTHTVTSNEETSRAAARGLTTTRSSRAS